MPPGVVRATPQRVESASVSDPTRITTDTGTGKGARRAAARRRQTYRRRRWTATAVVLIVAAIVLSVVYVTRGDDRALDPGVGASVTGGVAHQVQDGALVGTTTAASTSLVSPTTSVDAGSGGGTTTPRTTDASADGGPAAGAQVGADSSTTAAPSTTVATTPPSTAPATPLAAATVVRHGPTDRKWIALTFDDNYQGTRASNTIKVLTKYKVPATFFIIGHYLDLGPKLGREIAAAGFEVGDHTRSHSNCPTLSKRGLRIEIGNGTDHYRALTGAPTVALFRPPGGFIDDKTCEVAAEEGFKYVVMWDVDTNDWRGRSAAQITETVMGNAHNGAIVLMHMAAKHTAEALPAIITRLRDAGYELVTLSTMLSL